MKDKIGSFCLFILFFTVALLMFSSCAAPSGTKDNNHNLPPTVPVLIYPSDGGNVDYGNSTFTWQNSSDPDSDNLSYKIFLSKKIENLNEGINVNGNQFIKDFSISDSGTWFWRVAVSDGNGFTVLSDEIRYLTVGNPPAVESDRQEDNDLMVKNVSDSSFDLEWPEFVDKDNPGYEMEYSVYVLEESGNAVGSRNSSRAADVVFNATTTSRNMNVNTLMKNKHYRWMVLAAAQGGTKTKVGESEVKTGNTPPSTPVLKQPDDGMEQLMIPVQLSWDTCIDSDGDDVEYDVYVDTDSFPKKKVAKRIDETAVSSEDFNGLKLSEGTTYYWRVVAKDDNGGYAVSEIFEFKTAGDSSNNPEVEWVAIPEALIESNEFKFEWAGSDKNGEVEYYEYKKDDFDASIPRAHSIWKKTEESEYTWENISNGEHTFSVRAVDDEGNYSETINTCFRVDLGIPQIQWIKQASGTVTESSFEFEWSAHDMSEESSARDIIKYKFRKESFGTPENPYYDYGEWVFTEDTVYTWESIPQGRNRFIVKAKNDRYVYSEEIICEFYCDKNTEGAPVVEWKVIPPEVLMRDNYKFEWNGSDAVSARNITYYEYSEDYFGEDSVKNRDTGEWENTTDEFYVWEDIEFGKHSFSVRAKDDEGNYSNILTAFFYKSGENPTVTWVEKPEGTITDGKFTFEWEGYDSNGDDAEYYEFRKERNIDSSQRIYDEWIRTSLKYFYWNGIPEGKHRFSIRAVDKYGNKSEEISVEFHCDIPKPTVEWVKKPGEEIDKNYFDFEWIGFDGLPQENNSREIIKYKYRKISWLPECQMAEERTSCSDSGWIFTDATGVRWDDIPTGTHKMMVESKNNQNIYSDPIYVEFRYEPDMTKMPTVTWVNIPEDSITDNSFTFEWVGNDPEEVAERRIIRYDVAMGSMNGRPSDLDFEWNETYGSTYTWNDIPVGRNYFAVRSVDDDENYSEAIVTDFTKTLPDVLEWINSPEAIVEQNSFRFEWRIKADVDQNVNDITGFEYCKDYSGGSSERVVNEWVFTTATECLWEGISEGSHSFVVRAVFGDGSHSQLLRSVFEYECVEKIPVVEWVTKPSTEITDDIAEFEWRGFTETRVVDPDEVYAYEYKKISHDYINATTTESEWTDIQATGVTWENISIGYHRMKVRAYTFNQTYSEEISCDFSRTPTGEGVPVLGWVDVPGEVLEYDSFTFSWTGTDTSSYIGSRSIEKYEIAKGNVPPEGEIPAISWEEADSVTYEWNGITQGYKYFAVRAIDDQGNYSMPLYSLFLCRGIPAEVTDDLIFIHHSVGNNWLESGLRVALGDKEYVDEVNEIYYGTVMVPDENRPASLGSTPGDNTDMDHWLFWFNDYLDGILSEGSEDGRNRIVMFKSCYPNSAVTSVGSTETADPFSSEKTLENYKAVFRYPEGRAGYTHEGYDYKSLDKIFAENPNTIFIVVTSPPQCWDEADPENAARAREFNNWLKYHWIEFYQEENKIGDEYPRNVYIFDWFDFLACSPDDLNHSNMLKEKYGGDSGDSHPNLLANHESTEYFASSQNNVIDYFWEEFDR